MKKKILTVLFSFLLMVTPVLAANDTATGSDNSNGNSTKAAEIIQAREYRITIKSQALQLAQLRETIREKIATQKALIKQYRTQSKLTDEQRTNVKNMIETMKSVQEKLATAYQNATSTLKQYKSDKSSNKITGLQLVIDSQNQRIQILNEIITELE